VPGIRVTAQGVPGRELTTPPNGRLEVCVPPAGSAQLTADAPAQAPPAATDYLDAVAVVDAGAIAQTARTLSFRALTNARKVSFYQERALTYDPARGHLLIYLTGDRTALSVDVETGAPLGGDDSGSGAITWGMDGGRYRLFPNVSVAEGTARISGAPDGVRAVPVAANQLTLVMMHFTF
jgi:hypothetical protein